MEVDEEAVWVSLVDGAYVDELRELTRGLRGNEDAFWKN